MASAFLELTATDASSMVYIAGSCLLSFSKERKKRRGDKEKETQDGTRRVLCLLLSLARPSSLPSQAQAPFPTDSRNHLSQKLPQTNHSFILPFIQDRFSFSLIVPQNHSPPSTPPPSSNSPTISPLQLQLHPDYPSPPPLRSSPTPKPVPLRLLLRYLLPERAR